VDTEQLIKDVVRKVMDRLESEKVGTVQPDTSSKTSTTGGEIAKVRNGSSSRKIVCGVSVRHVHLCREDLDILYGKGYELKKLRDLFNPGFAAEETVTIVGPKLNAIQNVRILGPLRDKSQVELAKTDCIILGIDAEVRPSGNLEGSSSAVVIGPKGAVYLKEGVIRANRHIHMDLDNAGYYGIKDNQLVDVRVGGPKGLTFNNVQVRVAEDFKTEMHVDTDDANAADISNGAMVELVDASCVSPIANQVAMGENIPPAIPDTSYAGEITDTNVLKSINSVLSEKTSTLLESEKNSNTALSKKIVITVDDLEKYKDTGITLDKNTILSPLARDEAKERGIKITE